MVYRAELDHYDRRNNLSIEEDKAELPKKRSIVAIKRIFNTEGKKGFFGEIEMLTQCQHQNIVSLVGFCDEGTHMILVYEYVANGSLDDYLGNTSNLRNLPWSRRIEICLDIAHGLNYLHTSTNDKQMIVHRDIKSANILLGDNWEVKIADFGLSKLRSMNKENSTLVTNHVAGTEVYLDPEYMKTGKLKKEVDIYSFGVVLFEIMCGKVAYDESFNVDNEKGLPSLARRRFKEGRLKEMVDPKIREAYEDIFMRYRGVNQDSLDTFSKIAYQCLAETQAERPRMEVIINELEKALSFEENHNDNLQISFEDIKLATQNFSHTNCVGSGRYWNAYEGEVPHANASGQYTTIIAKRWDSMCEQGDHQFQKELDTLFTFKHENIIGLAGYCNEMNERIIVYDDASNGSLSKYLNDASFTWMKRLKISIDVATGLAFLHETNGPGQAAVHRGLKSASILLDGNWKAKISNLELTSTLYMEKDMEQVIHNGYDALGYLDPAYKLALLTDVSDVYSLGVILFEIVCGRLAWPEGCNNHSQSLGPLAKHHYEEWKLTDMVFKDIREQIVPQSFITFASVAYACLNDRPKERPTASEVVVKLNKALEFQEDYDIWEAKLPKDYKKIIETSKSKEIIQTLKNPSTMVKVFYDMLIVGVHLTRMPKDLATILQTSKTRESSSTSKKVLFEILNKGTLLQEDKVWFALGSNGEKNEMISARNFSYKKRWLHRWRCVPLSRFPKVAEVLDISNLMIQIKMRTQFLSPGVDYRVLLIFKFCGPRKSSAKQMYVNLRYKKGNENLNAYFATWRQDEWMMIELGRFLCCKEDTDIDLLLESFSRCYCQSRAIYVDGIEFQAIENVTLEKIEKLKEVQPIDNVMKNEEIEKLQKVQVVDNVKYEQIKKLIEVRQVMKPQRKRDKMLSMLTEMNTKKDHLLSKVNRMKDHLYSPKALFSSKPSSHSRFEAENEEMNKTSDDCEKLLSKSKLNTNKHHMLSAKEALYVASNVMILHLKPSVQSRFEEVVKLLSQQVFRIKCKIGNQMLLPDTQYACYIVFKFSEKCDGLHCPVIVRDLLRRRNKETVILYFRSPDPWNLHEYNRVPEKREDGWMEVNVWKFNSTFDLRNECIYMDLKLIAYEGTMYGLIIAGLEIRPM